MGALPHERTLAYRVRVERILRSVQKDFACRLAGRVEIRKKLDDIVTNPNVLPWWIGEVCEKEEEWDRIRAEYSSGGEGRKSNRKERVRNAEKMLGRLLGTSLMPFDERQQVYFYAGIYHPLLTKRDRDGIIDTVHVPRGEGSVGYTADVAALRDDSGLPECNPDRPSGANLNGVHRGVYCRTVASTLREFRGHVSTEDIIGGNLSTLMAALTGDPASEMEGKDSRVDVVKAVLFCFFPFAGFFPADRKGRDAREAREIERLFTEVASAHRPALLGALANAHLEESLARISEFVAAPRVQVAGPDLERPATASLSSEHLDALRSLVVDRSEYDPVGAVLGLSFAVEGTFLRPTALRISARHMAGRLHTADTADWLKSWLFSPGWRDSVRHQVPAFLAADPDALRWMVEHGANGGGRDVAPVRSGLPPYLSPEPLFPVARPCDTTATGDVPECVLVVHRIDRGQREGTVDWAELDPHRAIAFEPLQHLFRARSLVERSLAAEVIPRIASSTRRRIQFRQLDPADFHGHVETLKLYEDTAYSLLALFTRILARDDPRPEANDRYVHQINTLLHAARSAAAEPQPHQGDGSSLQFDQAGAKIVQSLLEIRRKLATGAGGGGSEPIAVSAFYQTTTRPLLYPELGDSVPPSLQTLFASPGSTLLARLTHLLALFAAENSKGGLVPIEISLNECGAHVTNASLADKLLDGLGFGSASLARAEHPIARYRIDQIQAAGPQHRRVTTSLRGDTWRPAVVEWILGPRYVPVAAAVNEKALREYCDYICDKQRKYETFTLNSYTAQGLLDWLLGNETEPLPKLIRSLLPKAGEESPPMEVHEVSSDTDSRNQASSEVFVLGFTGVKSSPTGQQLIRAFKNYRQSLLNTNDRARERERAGMGIGMFHNLGHFTGPLKNEAAVLLAAAAKIHDPDRAIEVSTRNVTRLSISLGKFQRAVLKAMLPERLSDPTENLVEVPLRRALLEALRPTYLSLYFSGQALSKEKKLGGVFGAKVLAAAAGCPRSSESDQAAEPEGTREQGLISRPSEDPSCELDRETIFELHRRASSVTLPPLQPTSQLDELITNLSVIGIQVKASPESLDVLVPDVLGVLALEELLRNAVTVAAVARRKHGAQFRIDLSANPGFLEISNTCPVEYAGAVQKPVTEPSGRDGWGRFATQVTLDRYRIGIRWDFDYSGHNPDNHIGRALCQLHWTVAPNQ